MKRNAPLLFQVDARLVSQLGEQLVPSDVTALAELVKNAYDADATMALIDYYPDSDPPKMVIEDDGHGMTLGELTEGWMTIGTALKEKHDTSPLYRRVRAGRKGIGRFAVQRLGRRLTLSSTARGTDTAIEVVFDWSVFAAGTPLAEIGYEPHFRSVPKQEHWSRLTIEEVRREWKEEDLKEVLEELIRLQGAPRARRRDRQERSPKDPGFDVLVAINGSRLKKDFDETDLLRQERAWSIHGKVDQSGKASYRVEFHKPKGRAITETVQRTLKTGPLDFSLDVFTYAREYLDKLSIRQAADLGKRYGGCRIWRDGFRVYAYGEPKDDWLGLDAHVAVRGLPLNMPRNIQILGGVRITGKDNPDFVDLLTRRGLLENEAFRHLRGFVFEVIRVGANEHGALTAKETQGGPARSKPSEATLREVRRAREEREKRRQERRTSMLRAAERGKVAPEVLKELEKEAEAEERSQRHREESILEAVAESEKGLIDENAMLRVLASLGTGLATFSHETRMVSSAIGVAAQEIQRLLDGCPRSVAKEIAAQLHALQDGLDDLAAYRKYIDDFIRASSRRKRRPVELGPYIKELLETFAAFLKARSIAVKCGIPRGLVTAPIHRAELNSVVFNILTNAVKAVLSPEAQRRELFFTGSQEDAMVSLLIADTGCGIPPGVVGRVFEPFVTRALVHDGDVLGPGTGLGLTLVSDIVESYGGSISVVGPPQGYRTAFEVHLPSKD